MSRLPAHGLLAAALLTPVLVAASARAQTGWRSDGSGLFPQASPPVSWSVNQNVVWKTPLPVWSNASPVVHRRRVFVCQEPSTLTCLDQSTGKVLWTSPNEYADVATGEEAGRIGGKPPTHPTNGYASPTPVALGLRVYVLFGNGVAACYDLDGKRVWARFVAKSTDGWGHSSSPVLAGGTMVVHINGTVHGLDANTGEAVWKTGSAGSWGSPLLLRFGQEGAVLTMGGDVVRCSDGKVVARGVGTLPWSSPIVHQGTIYIVDEAGAFAFRLPERLADPLNVTKLWQNQPKRDRYYASPIFDGGLVYAVTQTGHLSILEAESGKIVYQKQLNLGGTYYPSLSLAGGRIFLGSDTGTMLVLEPGREPKEVGTIFFEPSRSTPFFEEDRVYVRTFNAVYCLGADRAGTRAP